MTFRPLADRVLVQPDAVPTESASGLHLVEHWTIETTGTVVGIGPVVCPTCDAPVTPAFAVGDVVVFSGQAGQEFRLENTRYLLLRHRDILAVMEPA